MRSIGQKFPPQIPRWKKKKGKNPESKNSNEPRNFGGKGRGSPAEASGEAGAQRPWAAPGGAPWLHPRSGRGGRGGAAAGARVRSRRTSAGMGRSRRQSPGRALGRRQRRRWRAGGVRRGGVGGGGENPSWAIVSIKKRQSVPGRRLSALELLLGKERGGKKEKEDEREMRKG